jgi:hypothetical protein
MFAYDLGYHGNDVIHLIDNETKAQCADDANMLVALLRSVGIPSHPVTVDAAMEYGPANWNFDTWTEALMEGSAGKKWYALHPHQANGIGPVERGVAGAGGGSWGVATKLANDLAIMALETWNTSQVSDGNPDVIFSWDTPCKEPAHAFVQKAAWLEHLCLNNSTGDGYWGKGHWTCSPPYKSDVTVTVDKRVYRVGDLVRIGITVANKTKRTQRGVLQVAINEDQVFSKKYPDRQHAVAQKKLKIAPGKKQRVEVEFKLPLTLSSDRDYAVSARFGEIIGQAAFKVETLYSARLVLPKVIRANESFVIELDLKNAAKHAIDDIKFNLILPYEVKTKEGSIRKKISGLKAKESTKLRWKLYPQAPSEVAAFQIEIRSANGGSSVVRGGIEIAGPPARQPNAAVAPSR